MYGRVFTSCLLMSVITSVGGFCSDFEGKRVGSGKQFFDGSTWILCTEDDQQAEIEFMKEKWSFMFTAFDFDQDKLITRKDSEIFKSKFNQFHRLCDSHEVKDVSNLLDRFFNCIFLESQISNHSLSKENFFSIYEKAFITNREETKTQIHRCNSNLVAAIDRDGDCLISYTELFKNYKSWGENDRELVDTIFKLMGPNIQNKLPREHYNKFYVELTMGTNKEIFTDMRDAYIDAGFHAKFTTC